MITILKPHILSLYTHHPCLGQNLAHHTITTTKDGQVTPGHVHHDPDLDHHVIDGGVHTADHTVEADPDQDLEVHMVVTGDEGQEEAVEETMIGVAGIHTEVAPELHLDEDTEGSEILHQCRTDGDTKETGITQNRPVAWVFLD